MLPRCAFWTLLVLQLASSAFALGGGGSKHSLDVEPGMEVGSPLSPLTMFFAALFLVMVSALVIALLVHRARRKKPTRPRQESPRD